VPQQLADSSFVPSVYFSGLATKDGQTSVPINFKYLEVETITWGRGSLSDSATGVYKLYAYIPADEVGSCSIAGNSTQTACTTAGGTWTVDAAASLLTTSKMSVGDWNYEIRMADAVDTSGLESSKTLLYGILTISASTVDISPGSSFNFDTPDTP
jgi:hypothetical protein